MRATAWQGDRAVLQREYYSGSGAYHGAFDVAMPRGTKLFAPIRCKVLALNDGVPNRPDPLYNGQGFAANGVLLGYRTPSGHWRTIYYGHMSPGIVVKVGQRLDPGDLVGRSGTTGNTSAPHLHAQVLKAKVTRWEDRYVAYPNHPDRVVYGPRGRDLMRVLGVTEI